VAQFNLGKYSSRAMCAALALIIVKAFVAAEHVSITDIDQCGIGA
jgi:hypothetical protein